MFCRNTLFIIIYIGLLFKWYLDKFSRYISIYKLFPSKTDIIIYKTYRFARVNIDGRDTVYSLGNPRGKIKEHSNRLDKIRIHINMRISPRIKNHLLIYLAHIRYKPGSCEYFKIRDRFKNNYNYTAKYKK